MSGVDSKKETLSQPRGRSPAQELMMLALWRIDAPSPLLLPKEARPKPR